MHTDWTIRRTGAESQVGPIRFSTPLNCWVSRSPDPRTTWPAARAGHSHAPGRLRRNAPLAGLTQKGKKQVESHARGPLAADYFLAAAKAFAVALIMASEVIVALLVVSTPFTLCLARIFLRGVGHRRVELLFPVLSDGDTVNLLGLHADRDFHRPFVSLAALFVDPVRHGRKIRAARTT